MRNLSILKTLASILFVLCMIGIFFGIPCILMIIFLPASIPFKINGEPAGAAGVETIILLFAVAAGFSFFTYALYLFKKVLELFEKKKIFHDDVIKNLNQTGKAIIIGYFIIAVAYTFHQLFVGKSIEISTNDITETLLTLGLGLFFMVLSEVFLIAKGLKEENDLTV